MKRLRSASDGIRDQVSIEGGQLSSVCASQCQEVTVCHVSGIKQATADHMFCIKHRDVVGPGLMAG